MLVLYNWTVFVLGVLLAHITAKDPVDKAAPKSQMLPPVEFHAPNKANVRSIEIHRPASTTSPSSARPITTPANYSVAINDTKISESWSFNIESGNKGQ
jgi:hypothetical protein